MEKAVLNLLMSWIRMKRREEEVLPFKLVKVTLRLRID